LLRLLLLRQAASHFQEDCFFPSVPAPEERLKSLAECAIRGFNEFPGWSPFGRLESGEPESEAPEAVLYTTLLILSCLASRPVRKHPRVGSVAAHSPPTLLKVSDFPSMRHRVIPHRPDQPIRTRWKRCRIHKDPLQRRLYPESGH